MKKQTAIDQMAGKVLGIRYDDMSERNLKILKDKLLDTVGCIIGGAKVSGNQGLYNIIQTWGGSQTAPVFMFGSRTTIGDAAMMNCISCRSNDFDSMISNIDGRRFPTHISGTSMPTALTLSDVFGLTGKEFLITALIGEDVSIRVATAGGKWDFNLGWDGSYCLPIWGAIAQMGRLYGLDANQVKNAWGIGLNLISGSIGNIYDFATAFKLGQGLAAKNADFAVRLAQQGWNGLDDPLTGEKNFYFMYRGMDMPCNPEILTNDFGKKFYMEESFKLFPCGIPSVPLIKSGIKLFETGLKTSRVESIDLHLAEDFIGMYYTEPFKLGPDPLVNAMYSYQFVLCVALLRGRMKIEDYNLDLIKDPDLLALIEKTRILRDSSLPSGHLRVRVKMTTGEVVEDSREASFDMHRYPEREQLVEKFWDQVNASGQISQQNAEKLVDLIDRVEELEDMRSITSLLMPLEQ